MAKDFDPAFFSGACLSAGRTHRYILNRTWAPFHTPKAAVFIMLNPSTADEATDDPTIRRCTGFAQRLVSGCTGIQIINLFAVRSKDPKVLFTHSSPIGDQNDEAIQFVVQQALAINMPVIAAWGTECHASIRARAQFVFDNFLFQASERRGLFCLKYNGDGSPAHPLYLPNSIKLTHYSRGRNHA